MTSGGISKFLLHNRVEGKNNTFVAANLSGLIHNRTYGVVLNKDNWTILSVTSGYAFVVRSIDSNGDWTNLVSVAPSNFSSIKSFYTFTVPLDSVRIEIGGRADVGTAISFDVVDYDFTKFISTKFSNLSFYLNSKNSPIFNRTISADTVTMSVGIKFPVMFRILDADGKKIVDYSATQDYVDTLFTIDNYECLSWDLITNSLSVIGYTNNNTDSFIPILGVMGASVFGIAKPYYDRWVETTIKSVTDALDSKIDIVDNKVGDAIVAKPNIKKGSLTTGIVNSGIKFCLCSDVFVKVNPSSTFSIIRASDISVRIAEYSSDDQSTYIKQSGAYAKMNSYTVGVNTNFIRIAGDYQERGFSDSNPVSINDYQDGDFALYDNLKNVVEKIDNEINGLLNDDDIVQRNKVKIERIKAVSKTAVSGYSEAALPKNFTFVIATDIHANIQCLNNAIDLADKTDVVDAVFNLGDQQASYYDTEALPDLQTAVTRSRKPMFVVLGNHDVGNSKKVRFCCNNQQAYIDYIKPIVDAGYLAEGEYQEGKCYYYHDLPLQKLRLIVLNFYDEIMELSDSDYWEPIQYDSTYPLMENSVSYAVGDVVNCGVYKDHSFRCIAACTSGSSSGSNGQEPLFKMFRGHGVIQEEQAQWLLDVLYDTPENYSVLIASHTVFSQNVTALTNSKFCENTPLPPSISNDAMLTDFVAEAINAFTNSTDFSINVKFKSEASYMHRQDGYAYTVNKDFTTRNENGKFIGYINGHFHEDIIWEHNTYSNQKSVSPITSSPTASLGKNQDVYRSKNINDVNYDALTIVGIDTANSKICLARIGADISTDMYVRDIEKI